jgi:hypothetical protein
MTKFTTLQPHIGDRANDPYQSGETRELDDPAAIKHLTEGDDPILGNFDQSAEDAFNKAKAEAATPKNKAESKAPSNKANA